MESGSTVKTRQKLVWTTVDRKSGHFLLMPSSFVEFLEISTRIGPEQAFELVTGISIEGKTEIVLVQEYIVLSNNTNTGLTEGDL